MAKYLSNIDLSNILADLREEEALKITRERLNAGDEPFKILEDARKGMEIVGKRFSDGEYFIPDLIYSGEILKGVSKLVRPKLAESSLKQERLGNVSNENRQKKQPETSPLPKELKIMVLDDDADVVKLLTSYLSKYCDVMGLVNPGDSIKQIVKYEPDVLLIDICMPTLSGYQISQLMKLNPNLKKIKVIFISSKDAPAEIDYGFQLGAFDYITKPFEPEHVLDSIRNMCDID